MTLPDGWVWTTLGEATKPTQKRVNPQSYPDLPYIGMENIEPHTMRLLGTVPAKEMRSTADTFSAGDVLYGRLRPYLNKVYCPDFDGLCSTEFIVFRNVPHIHSKYLQLFLNSWHFVTFANSLNAGDRPRVKFEQLAEYPFPLPPPAEQERVVSRIESLFSQLEAGVAALKRARAALKRYRASVLKAACEGRLVAQDPNDEPAGHLLANRELGQSKKRAGRMWGSGTVPALLEREQLLLPETWQWVKVKDLGFNTEDAVQVGPMSMRSKDFVEKGVPVLNVGCVHWGYFDEAKLNFLPETKAKEFERYRVLPGDVLFTRSGTVGRSAVARYHQKDWLMTFHLLRVRPKPEICLPEYLQLVFEGASHIKRQTRDASIGTTRAGFNTNLLAMLDIPLPPIQEQQRIVAEVERQLSVAGQVEAAAEAGLRRAERLRQAILRRAFEGRLV